MQRSITWTNCADQMPPDDESRYIFTNLIYNIEATPLIYTGHSVNKLGFLDGDAWTEYTPEKWKELSK